MTLNKKSALFPSLLLAGALCLPLCGCDQLKSVSTFKTEDAFSEWMAFYYLHQSKNLVLPAMIFYSDSPMFENVNYRQVIAGFFAEIFKKDPVLMKEITQKVDKTGTDNTKSTLLRALWLADTEASIALLDSTAYKWGTADVLVQIPKIQGKHPRDLLQGTIDHPLHVDKLWHIFYASGSKVALKQIISALKYVDPVTQPSAEQYEMGIAAKESLIYHAARHRLVWDLCKSEQTFAQETTRLQLREVIRRAGEELMKDPSLKMR